MSLPVGRWRGLYRRGGLRGHFPGGPAGEESAFAGAGDRGAAAGPFSPPRRRLLPGGRLGRNPGTARPSSRSRRVNGEEAVDPAGVAVAGRRLGRRGLEPGDGGAVSKDNDEEPDDSGCRVRGGRRPASPRLPSRRAPAEEPGQPGGGCCHRDLARAVNPGLREPPRRCTRVDRPDPVGGEGHRFLPSGLCGRAVADTVGRLAILCPCPSSSSPWLWSGWS